jgi:hypothetical protein
VIEYIQRLRERAEKEIEMIIAQTTISGINVKSVALERGERASSAREELGIDYSSGKVSTMTIGDLDDGADYEDWAEFAQYQPEHARALVEAGANPKAVRFMFEIRL